MDSCSVLNKVTFTLVLPFGNIYVLCIILVLFFLTFNGLLLLKIMAVPHLLSYVQLSFVHVLATRVTE